MGVTLAYDFDPAPARPEPQLQNTLVRMLEAIQEHGSIGRGAAALGLSYRHVWGYLKEREGALGAALLAAEPGQAARLSAFGERLLWAERRAQARLVPLVETMAAKLDQELLLAARYGLDFIPVVKEHYFIVCHKPALDEAPARALLALLRSQVFREMAGALPGYDMADAGEIISLRRTLPWYK